MLKTLKKQSILRKLAVMAIIAMIIYLTVSYTSATNPLTHKDIFKMTEDNIRKTNPQLLEELSQEDHSRPSESIDALTIKKYNRVQIKSKPEISSTNDLDDYKNQRLAQIDTLSKSKKEDTKIEAIINFNKLITREDYLDFVKKYGRDIELMEIRARSTPPEFNSKLPVSNDQPLPSAESAKIIEDILKESGKNITLETHIESLTANIKVKDLKRIQNDPRVYLVDVGPVDVKEQYEDGKTIDMTWRYIFPEIERYGSE